MKPVVETSLNLLSVVLPSAIPWIIIRQYFSSYISDGTSSLLRTSVQPFSSFQRASVLPPAAATLPSVQPPTFVSFLTFLYWLLSLLYFSHCANTYFSYFTVTLFFFINSCALSYCLSFLSPDEASGRNVVNSTVYCLGRFFELTML